MKPKTHWLIDVVLFAGFVMSFFLNLTGLAWHQWLGVGIGVLALCHLLVHWPWVKKVTQRFRKCNWRMHVYYLLDVELLVGLAGIIVTGIVISSWLELPLANYLIWRQLHIFVSLFTLCTLVVKLGLHWQWIVKFAPRLRPARAPVAVVPASRGQHVSRRDFLVMMGVIGGAVAAAIYNVGRRNLWDGAPDPVRAMEASPATLPPTVLPTSTPGAFPTPLPSPPAPGEHVLDAPTATPFATPMPTATPTTATCTVRCPNACTYPGKCRRYIDHNANNLCDLGECL